MCINYVFLVFIKMYKMTNKKKEGVRLRKYLLNKNNFKYKIKIFIISIRWKKKCIGLKKPNILFRSNMLQIQNICLLIFYTYPKLYKNIISKFIFNI